jgi:hypothetical protein
MNPIVSDRVYTDKELHHYRGLLTLSFVNEVKKFRIYPSNTVST